MRTLLSGNSFVTVIVNKLEESEKVVLETIEKAKGPYVLFADKSGTVSAQTISISPEETLVIE